MLRSSLCLPASRPDSTCTVQFIVEALSRISADRGFGRIMATAMTVSTQPAEHRSDASADRRKSYTRCQSADRLTVQGPSRDVAQIDHAARAGQPLHEVVHADVERRARIAGGAAREA